MKISIILSYLFSTKVFVNTKLDSHTPNCDLKVCQLPDCRCSSTDVPGGLEPKNVPQFITLTFDGAINIVNMQTYRRILYNRNNSNDCAIGTTFFINHGYTNYQAVNELYNKGFEIALHSMTHDTSQKYWREATTDLLGKEFGNQRIQTAHFANIPTESIKGIRIPLLQMTGNRGFKMMKNHSLLYDASWPTVDMVDPGIWPYTLHHRSTQDCIIPPCPDESILGPWVIPMISWLDLQMGPCLFIDGCLWTPARTDEEDWYEFILKNFKRHYNGNKSPFGIFVHEWYLNAYPAVERALIRFMDLVNSLYDVFMVNTYEALEWVRNPIHVNKYRMKRCRSIQNTICLHHSCGPLRAVHNNMDYYMEVCSKCSRVYPWLDNPLGQ